MKQEIVRENYTCVDTFNTICGTQKFFNGKDKTKIVSNAEALNTFSHRAVDYASAALINGGVRPIFTQQGINPGANNGSSGGIGSNRYFVPYGHAKAASAYNISISPNAFGVTNF
jgi:hypothetical protein